MIKRGEPAGPLSRSLSLSSLSNRSDDPPLAAELPKQDDSAAPICVCVCVCVRAGTARDSGFPCGRGEVELRRAPRAVEGAEGKGGKCARAGVFLGLCRGVD